MTVVAMSHSELSRYDTLLRVKRRELPICNEGFRSTRSSRKAPIDRASG